MNHTYQEIRDAVCDLLAGRVRTLAGVPNDQFGNLKANVGAVLWRYDPSRPRETAAILSPTDSELLREVFYDLFREGIINPGLNEQTFFPFFQLTKRGRKAIAGQPSRE